MRIIHFIATNFVGGPEKQILNHLKRLRMAGQSILLVSFQETGGYALKEEAGHIEIDCELLPSGTWTVYQVMKQLRSLYEQWRPEVICAHGYKAVFYSSLLKLLTGCKYIGFSRGWTAENLRVSVYEMLDRLLIRSADRVVAVSEAQAKRLQRAFIPKGKIAVVANAVTMKEDKNSRGGCTYGIRKELGLNPDCRLLLTAGRLSPEKGHRYLLSAMRSIVDVFPDVHLLIAGDGQLREKLEKQSVTLQCHKHVHFLGFRRDLISLFEQVDVFVLPSLSEGLPNVIIESMILGVPVVATRVGGVPEIVNHEHTGLLVDAKQPAALTKAIAELLDDYEAASEMSIRAKEFVARHHSAEQQTDRLLKLYEEVAKE